MGIKALLPFIREKCPNAYRLYSFDILKNKVLLIDISIIMYAEKAKARREVARNTNLMVNFDIDENAVFKLWLQYICQFALTLLKHQIHPIFVFDGAPHEAKNAVKNKRKNTREEQLQDIKTIQEQLRNCPEMQYPKILIDNLLHKLINFVEVKFNEVRICQELLAHMGLDIIQANQEAEQACAMLFIENRAHCIFSRDSDVLAYGCPAFLNEITQQQGKYYFYGYSLDTILQELELTFEEFRDFVIMAGCDYNNNIKGIGIKRAYSLIKTYHSIDNLPQKYDISVLNHQLCREMFNVKPSEEVIKIAENLIVDDKLLGNNFKEISPYAFDICRQYNLENMLNEFNKCYKNFV